LFGQYKLFTPAFAHGGFEQLRVGFVQSQAVGSYKGFLQTVLFCHIRFYSATWSVMELFIGVCLLLGIWVRAGVIIGALHMLSLTLAT